MAIVFFDMDRTLLSENSGTLWTHYLYRHGKLSFLGLLRASWWLVLYRFALLDMDHVAARISQTIAGDSEDDLRQECGRWMRTEVARFIRNDARLTIKKHQQAGEICVILSSASPYATEPLAEMLGLSQCICQRLEVEEGRFTGRPITPLCYGSGKIFWAEQFASERNVALKDCAFYSDSYTDLPMLERVGRPVAVNPDPRLRRAAKQRGWPIEDWR